MEVEKTSSRVTFCRDYPPGCGSSLTGYKGLSFHRDFPRGCGPLAKKDNDCSEWRRSKGAVRSMPTTATNVRSNGQDVRNFIPKSYRPVANPPKVKMIDFETVAGENRKRMNVVGKGREEILRNRCIESGGVEEGGSRERVKVVEMLRVFRERCDELLKGGKVRRIDVVADKQLTSERSLVKQPALRFGASPGVEVGDLFYYRIELVIAGLHRLYQGGIDAMEYGGDRYATCIVANEGHLDNMSDPNVLHYIGEGGAPKRNWVGPPPDQQLSGGNLALVNSKREKMPVRVVRGLRYGSGNAKIVYVYDGLYEVTDVFQKRGPHGNMVYEFLMNRNPDQPAVPWNAIRRKFY